MTPKPGKVLLASRIVHEDKTGRLRVRVDCGVYTVESGAAKGPIQRLEINPEAMDALINAWPAWRKEVSSA